MKTNYDQIVQEAAEKVFASMEYRVQPEQLQQLKKAFEFAREAHKEQRRKSGEPYIIHPISVAMIAAEELMLDTNSVTASFLHDVVEDTPYTIEDISNRFGEDVAYLVDMVTKRKKATYRMSKQVDNYEQLLESVQYDIRALMVKLADRLHNMRTLDSMRPDKQMKIAGETDYFYAPLANRLGLFDVKTDLENLSFKFRCGLEYTDIVLMLDKDMKDNKERLKAFTDRIEQILSDNGITARAEVFWRKPYSLWRRMKSQEKDFWHLDNRYYVRVTWMTTPSDLPTETPPDLPTGEGKPSGCFCPPPVGELEGVGSDKNVCLRIYSLLTDVFQEKPGSFVNQIDQAKENSYKSINIMLLSGEGVWEDVQICSEKMVNESRFGCLAEVAERAITRHVGNDVSHENVTQWLEKFRKILKEIATESEGQQFIESVKTSLYYDDVLVFTPKGQGIILPKGATALDFAFELHTDIGMHAKYARINGKLSSIKTELKRGDCVEIGVDENSSLVGRSGGVEWLNHVCTFKAKRQLRRHFAAQLAKQQFNRCPHCLPLPGGETIGFRDEDGSITMHRRNCPEAIRLASKLGDSIVDTPFPEDPDAQYPVSITIKAIDRYHFLIDVVDMITNDLHLCIDSLHTVTRDDIIDLTVVFFVHSVRELVLSMKQLYTIEGVDEVRQNLA